MGSLAPARRSWQDALTLYTALALPNADEVRAHLADLDQAPANHDRH
jgi:hypothetical protein